MNSNQKIKNFAMHGATGLSVLHKDWVDWVLKHQNKPGFSQENAYGLGTITHHTWEVDGRTVSVPNEDWIYSMVLPDGSGFIGFERGWKPNNCVLLDAYGKERIRLTVPWQMTGAGSADGATFGTIDGPYPHPQTGQLGQFGVNGWVGNAKFYFELNYHSGQFLWCRPIWD